MAETFGHIRIDRKILNWEWYQDIKVFHLFLYFLLKANHKEGKWKGATIKRGELITGRLKCSKDTGLTEREIRTCLTKLKMTNEIATKTTNRFTVVTICKYDIYQSGNYNKDQQNDQQHVLQETNKRPTNDQQTTTNNNDNNNKNNKEEEYIKNTQAASPLNFYPKGEDFNGLPQHNFENIYRMVRGTKQIEVMIEDVTDLWEVFKGRLTGIKSYKNNDAVYEHFENWANKQSFRKKSIPKEKVITKKVTGIEFINNCTEVKMSDGSIQKLDNNQQDLAEYNLINPKSITKN